MSTPSPSNPPSPPTRESSSSVKLLQFALTLYPARHKPADLPALDGDELDFPPSADTELRGGLIVHEYTGTSHTHREPSFCPYKEYRLEHYPPGPTVRSKSGQLLTTPFDSKCDSLYRHQALLEESVGDGPLIGDVQPLASLRAEYRDNKYKNFVTQIEWLESQGFVSIRRAKGERLP